MKPSPENCFHLPVEVVLEIHSEAIRRFGGSAGIRDRALLESAVAAPQATWGRRSAYPEPLAISVVYLVCPGLKPPFEE